ncbi:MAG: ABC transporter ATP-binding protein [Candidatus Omnitrophica bacterium]|nr:ABC transporter ATP-binding protein [Candidatus Omnitrophota bacterium]
MLHFLDVTSGYGHKEVLKDVKFSIDRKEFIGIIGPNGSGKSTLLRTATKIIKPSKGEIYLEKKRLDDISLKELSKSVAVVPQGTMTTFPFKVMDMVLMGRIPYIENRLGLESKEDIRIAYESLKSVDALGLEDRFIDELSGGERQRVIIAKALAQKPKILFLDEPTTHLDIAHQIEIFSLLKKLNTETGLTIVTILHDLNLASDYCDKLILLSEGRIKKQGAPVEVLDYKTIEEVYKTCVIVKENPITSRPHVFLVKK